MITSGDTINGVSVAVDSQGSTDDNDSEHEESAIERQQTSEKVSNTSGASKAQMGSTVVSLKIEPIPDDKREKASPKRKAMSKIQTYISDLSSYFDSLTHHFEFCRQDKGETAVEAEKRQNRLLQSIDMKVWSKILISHKTVWSCCQDSADLFKLNIKSHALMIGLATHFFIFGILLSFNVYVNVAKLLNKSLAFDGTGTLASIFTTLITLCCMHLYSYLSFPAWVINGAFVPLGVTCLSYAYYTFMSGITCFLFWLQFYRSNPSSDDEITRIFTFGLLGVICINHFLCLHVLCIAYYYPEKSYFNSHCQAVYLYTYYRLKDLRKLLDEFIHQGFTPHPDFILYEIDQLDFIDQFQKFGKSDSIGTGKMFHLKNMWFPSYKRADILAQMLVRVPPYVYACSVIGATFLAYATIAALELNKLWNGDIEDHLNQLYAINSNLTELIVVTNLPYETDLIHVVIDYNQKRIAFWESLKDPLYVSIQIATWIAMVWSASFIPSLLFAYRQKLLKLRLQVPGAFCGSDSISRSKTFSPHHIYYFLGAWVSCVVVSFFLVAFVISLAILLFTWSATLKLMWEIRWLWVPLITVTIWNIFFKTFFIFPRFFETNIYENKDIPSHLRPSSRTVSKKRLEWNGFLLSYSLALLPVSGWSALMRALYSFGTSLLGLMRVDATLLEDGIQTYDTAFSSFTATLLYDDCMNNPIYLTAIYLFHQIKPSISYSWKRKKIINKWHLLVTLAMNPALIMYRKHNLDCHAEKLIKQLKENKLHSTFHH